MTFRLQVTEAQQNFGAMLDGALGDDVIVEREGAPQVAIVAYERYQELVAAQRELLRLRLQRASAAAEARAAALDDEEIDALIEEARNEAHADGLGLSGIDPQLGPVAPGTATQALAALREEFGQYFDQIEDVDAWVSAVRRGDLNLLDRSAQPDLLE